jgi:hypothetical protein
LRLLLCGLASLLACSEAPPDPPSGADAAAAFDAPPPSPDAGAPDAAAAPDAAPCCEFTIEVIDDDLGGNGGAVSAALDPSGALAVAYQTDHPFLRLARSDGREWTRIDVDGRATASTALAFDPAGAPIVALIDAIAKTLEVFTDEGGGWQSAVIDAVPLATFDRISLAVAPDGRRALVYTGYPTMVLADAEIRLATFAAGNWSKRIIADRGWLDSSLALDPAGAPWIAGFRSRGRPPVEVFAPPDHALGELVDSDGGPPALAIGPQGSLHLAYSGADGTELRYAENTGAGWQVETIAAAIGRSYQVWIAVGPEGRVYVPFFDNGENDLRLAVRSQGRWSVVTVDGPGTVGQSTAPVVDPSGRLHLFYFDQTRGDLKHAF